MPSAPTRCRWWRRSLSWGGLNFAIGTPIQTRILGWTADAPNLASSLIPSGFNVGIALAAFVGAMMLNAGYGYRSLPLLGIAAMIVAAAVALLILPPRAARWHGTTDAGRRGRTALRGLIAVEGWRGLEW